jgi:hypothetical protein
MRSASRTRADAVADDHGGTAFHHAAQFAQDGFFGGGVHGAERIVEEEDARLRDDGACDADALLLPTAQA